MSIGALGDNGNALMGKDLETMIPKCYIHVHPEGNEIIMLT